MVIWVMFKEETLTVSSKMSVNCPVLRSKLNSGNSGRTLSGMNSQTETAIDFGTAISGLPFISSIAENKAER